MPTSDERLIPLSSEELTLADYVGTKIERRMVSEIRQRRAADLSAEEVAAIEFMRSRVNFRDMASGDEIAKVNRAFIALDRLIGGRS